MGAENFPSGTVTFLFSDIVGSTALWERVPDAMGRALARHDFLLRRAIEGHAGHVFKTVGDAFCASFHTATDGMMAAIAAQRAIAAEVWPEGAEIRVRMALHTGSAEERGGDYYGQPLNRVARLLSAGHGGQILLSLATQELVRDRLVGQITLRDLGERRLKDLVLPERVFQVLASDLEQEFPPLRTLDSRSHNLPIQLTSFVGREKEIEEIKGMVLESRTTTLVGAGGAGKTRLAMQVSAEVIDRFEDGVWLVELAPLADPAHVVHAVGQALGIREETGVPFLATLLSAVGKKRLLLILDNCEHLVDASARLADCLVRSCENLRVLATSREALNIQGEVKYRVPSLAMPAGGQVTAEAVCQSESARLFQERATQSNAEFRVTHENARALADLCVRLDGIPLALELAAARSRTLSVQEINARLDDRFRLLTGGGRTAVPRQKTLRALVDWSYDLLTEEERSLLRRLSVFVGGWNLTLADGVCSDPEEPYYEDVLDLLGSLIDKSLALSDTQGAETRFHLLQTVHHYGRDRLEEAGEAAVVRRRHRDVFLALAEQGAQQMRGPNQRAWLDTLELEHDNLRAALTLCLEEGDPDEKGLRMCSNLYLFWWIRGHWSEGTRWHERMLAITSSPSAARGAALSSAGSLALFQGDYATAVSLYEESLAVHEGLASPKDVATALHNIAHVAHLKGDLATAKPLYRKSLDIRRGLGDALGVSSSLNNLANVAQGLGDYEEARTMHEENLSLRRGLGASQGIAQTLQNLGCLACEMGEFGTALGFFREAIGLMLELRDVRSVSEVLDAFAEIASKTGSSSHAAQLWGAADSLRASIGAPLHELDRGRQEEAYEAVRADIGSEAFELAWRVGRDMDMESACALATVALSGQVDEMRSPSK